MNTSKITYNYQGIISNNFKSGLRFAIALFGIPFLKNMLRFIPGIDAAIYAKEQGDDFFVEIVPAFMGFFSSHWEIREIMAKRFNSLGVKVRSIHAPYIEDGKIYQTNRKSYLDNIFDLTAYNSQTWFCLYSHIHLYEMIAERDQEKVLVVHPLPASPKKSEKEIINTIVRNVKKVLPVFVDQNVKLVIENLPWLKGKHERYTTLFGDALFFEKLMNEIDHDNVGVIFDWGHANSYSRYMYDHGIKHPEHEFNKETLEKFSYQNYFVKRLRPKLYYGHLNFNEAHDLSVNPPFFYKNFDSHTDLTSISEVEYPYYKKNIQELQKAPNLIGMTLETIPSFFSRKNRIQRYKDSIEILNSMLQSQS